MTLPTNYQTYIQKSRYARFDDAKGRREDWHETVERYINFFQEEFDRRKIDKSIIPWNDLRAAIIELEVMPSMRAMKTAGKALERDHVAGYNCSYLPIDSLRAFDEVMYILMCGTGVGFSVERQYINKLPEVPDELYRSDTCVVFEDSKIGWAKGYREFISLLFSGQVPRWDLSNIRPKGARLKTFGGRASGPEPLDDLLRFTENVVSGAKGRRLTSIECHDIVCKIADIVVCGGVRRSALISLSNLTDERMRHAKSGQWWVDNPQRALANNSVAYTERPDMGIFLREWESLYQSKSGERGIFSRAASQAQAAKYGRRSDSIDYGTNPCSEIILQPNQFCNLSEVVARRDDTWNDLRDKVRLATMLGTIQAVLTDFRYIGRKWKTHTEAERLLGVSLTGILDCQYLSDFRDRTIGGNLDNLRRAATETNASLSSQMGIEPSAAVTCVKPSGTVSQLCNSSSGIHPRYADYYIRRVRGDAKDPIGAFMADNGIPCEPDFYNPSANVYSFPIKSPEGCITRKDLTAIDQLDLWKVYQDWWCEHKPSITVYVRENEWMEVGAWVYRNFDSVSGVSFLPYDNGTYRQAPYEEIDQKTYEDLTSKMPTDLDWNTIKEIDDDTTVAQELACSAGVCEL